MSNQIKQLYLLSLDDKQDFCYQRFAKLIVQECIKELETTQLCDPYTGEPFNSKYNDVLAEGIVNIKETFGVE